MAPSPKHADAQGRVIRELARTFPRSSPPRPLSSPERDSNESTFHLPTATASSFNPEQEALNSTQQMEPTGTFNNLRSTARRYGHSYYEPPQAPQTVPTSAVRKEFGDFDSYENEDSEDDSIEVGRGGRRSLQSTPNKTGDLFMSNMNFNSLYDITPPSKSRAPTRRGNAAETGSLRRDAQIRHASTKPPAETDDEPPSVTEQKRSAFSDVHAKVAEEDSFQDQRPSITTSSYKGTRFGNLRVKHTSANHDLQTTPERKSATPQRQSRGTPRSSLPTNKDTQQSFMLPDLPNLTELVSGVFKDGTPVFSKMSRTRSRFSSAPDPDRPSRGQPNYLPINNVPVPEDEKTLFAALQLLKEKVSQLERENAEHIRTIEEQENEITDLKAEQKVQQAMRSSDSALGSDEEADRAGWKTQKSRLEAAAETLRMRLDRTDRKLLVAKTYNNRITAERDQLQEQLAKAYVTSEEVKQENQALQVDNVYLRSEVELLRSDKDGLRADNEDLKTKMASNEARYQEETLQLRSNMGRHETAVQEENNTLHTELQRVRSHHDEQAQRWMRREAELRIRNTKQEQAELSKLRSDNNVLKDQLENAKLQREQDEQRWNREEARLRQRLGLKHETICPFSDIAPEEGNETLRFDNENLRGQLERLANARHEEQQQWQRKEERLRRKIEKNEEVVRDMEEMTQDIVDNRRKGTGNRKSTAYASARPNQAILRRTTSNRQDINNTQTRLSDAVDAELHKSRTAAVAHDVTRRPGNPIASRFMRSTSVPLDHNVNLNSDAESTTDLSLERTQRTHTVTKPVPATTSTEEPVDVDYTYLSMMDGNEVARLRKILEKERAEVRRKGRVDSIQQERNDTQQSVRSAKKSTGHSHPRKSSMKDSSKRLSTIAADRAGNDTRSNDNEVSIMSNTGRRRRSFPLEMTSAFIIPDLTVRLTQREANHEVKDCTVCQRSASETNVLRHKVAAGVEIPKPIPVTSRNIDDSNATLRPAQSPQDALALVLKELEDELTHLKLELSVQESLLHCQDPSLAKRKRKAVHTKVLLLFRAIDIKADQIYALHDVLEGQKADGLLNDENAHQAAQTCRMTEEEVDNTLRSVGLDPKEARKGKKVVIEEDVDDSALDGLDDEDDLPWSGISDTESNAGPSQKPRRRSSVY
ncbi:hypothetical protein EJ05DRAFT_498409 [Pseudovirgaria hyperparasitica]|uniref:Cep57 centrosome microtubule-binding domain-containing protein n=1 Tax=Pseudovirgaria hyperparasitica TaxID=470096 RepID=A0A6A6WFS2_9PEZI|nr:uncharacterized protein EJ05DRAFT_498409 [Pseudovirgaria hyperparasitica]KAF2760447.1 hypothetical protein EJ05DRAFT_498409 [Pseudovirgaria hyperparasitica]